MTLHTTYLLFAGGLVLLACNSAGDARESPPDARPDSANVFDPASIQVGDSVAGIILEDVRRERTPSGEWVGSARFGGTVALTGRTFAHPDGADYPFPCFEADSASATRLPRWQRDERRPWFCFENAPDARAALGSEAGRPATIRVDRFTIHRNLSDAVNSVRLLDTSPGDGMGAAPSSRTGCFQTTESVLARQPGTVVPGPAGLTGWVRLEGGSTPGSGTGWLIDSDRRGMPAAWTDASSDSISVTAFDDFLRVEMRLAVTDSGAAGRATARSDAALVRDSTGRMVDFQRTWRVSGRRVSCDRVPEPVGR